MLSGCAGGITNELPLLTCVGDTPKGSVAGCDVACTLAAFPPRGSIAGCDEPKDIAAICAACSSVMAGFSSAAGAGAAGAGCGSLPDIDDGPKGEGPDCEGPDIPPEGPRGSLPGNDDGPRGQGPDCAAAPGAGPKDIPGI